MLNFFFQAAFLNLALIHTYVHIYKVVFPNACTLLAYLVLTSVLPCCREVDILLIRSQW